MSIVNSILRPPGTKEMVLKEFPSVYEYLVVVKSLGGSKTSAKTKGQI